MGGHEGADSPVIMEHEITVPETQTADTDTDTATEASLPASRLPALKNLAQEPEGWVEIEPSVYDDRDDSYSDSENEGIKGIYFTTEDGRLVEIEDPSHDSDE